MTLLSRERGSALYSRRLGCQAWGLLVLAWISAVSAGCREPTTPPALDRKGAHAPAADEAEAVRPPVAAMACGPFRIGSKRASLLAGRLTMATAEGADDVPRPHDIMSAPAPSSLETRLRLEVKGATFVALATEQWQTDPGFDAIREKLREIHRWPGEEDLIVERVAASDARLRLYVMRPTRYAAQPDGGTTLATGAVVLPDSTIATVRVLADVRTVTQSPEACSRFAEAMLATLAKGDRDLDTREGPTRLGPVRLSVDKPRGSVLVHNRGPDFDTFQWMRPSPLGLRRGSLAIIVDPYLQSPPTAPEVARGVIAGKPVIWYGEVDADGGRMWARPEIPGFKVTLSAAGDRGDLAEMQRVAESLRITE